MKARCVRTAPFGVPVVPPVKKMAAGWSGSTTVAGTPSSAMEEAGRTFTPWSFAVRGLNSSRTNRAAMSNFMQEPMRAISGREAGRFIAT